MWLALIYRDGPYSCGPLDYRWPSVHTSSPEWLKLSNPPKKQELNIKPKRILRPHTRIRIAKHNPAWKETKEEGDWEKKEKKVIRRSFKSSILLKASSCSPSLAEHIYFCVSCLHPLAHCVRKALLLWTATRRGGFSHRKCEMRENVRYNGRVMWLKNGPLSTNHQLPKT